MLVYRKMLCIPIQAEKVSRAIYVDDKQTKEFETGKAKPIDSSAGSPTVGNYFIKRYSSSARKWVLYYMVQLLQRDSILS